MNKKSLVAIALLAVSAILSAQSVYPGPVSYTHLTLPTILRV